MTQAEFGNSAKARELATSSGALVRDRGNLESVALALAMTGDVSRAQAIEDDLDHRFPDDLLLHQVNIPCVRALIELQRKAPEQAVQALEAVRPYELGASVAFLPTYIRGQAYLQAKRGTEAAAEFQKIVDHRGINPTARRAFAGQAGPGPGLCDQPETRPRPELPIRISWRCGRTRTPIFQSSKKPKRSTRSCSKPVDIPFTRI